MKKFLSLILAFICLSYSCGKPKSSFEKEFNNADSLMSVKPQEALIVMENLQPNIPNFNADDRARYALLMTQAMLRNRKAPENDSLIMSAVRYYSKNRDTENLAWSYVCASDVADKLGNDSIALWRRIRMAKKLSNEINNPELQYYVHYFLGNMLAYKHPYTEAMAPLQKAKEFAHQLNDPSKMIVCGNVLAGIYLYMNKYYDAIDELSGLLPLLDKSTQNRYISETYYKMALANYFVDNTPNALFYINYAINNIVDNNSNRNDAMYRLKGGILVKMQDQDSALEYIKKGRSNNSFGAIGAYALDMSGIAESRGDYLAALNYYKEYAAALDSIHEEAISNHVLEWQKKYDLLDVEAERDRLKIRNREVGLIATLLLIAILIVAFYIVWRSQRNKILMSERERAMSKSIEQMQMRINQLLKSHTETEEILKEHIFNIDSTLSKIIELRDSVENSTNIEALTKEEIGNMIKSVNICNNGIIQKIADSYPKLTFGNLAYIGLVILGLRVQEIAILLNVSHNTLKMRRKRIKEKLEIDPNASLEKWILDKLIHNQ